MKVYIGKPRGYFGPYQLAEALCFWVKKVPDEYGILRHPEWVHNFGHFLAYGYIEKERPEVWVFGDTKPQTWLSKLLNWIDSKRPEQISYIKIDRHDTWSMHCTLAPIIIPMLKQLKERKHGTPGTMPGFQEEGLTEDERHAKGVAQWEEILDKMIWSFEQLLIDWEAQYCSGEHDIHSVKFEVDGKTLYRMVRGPNDTFKMDTEGMRAHEARMQEGFELFGKYYMNLWD